jgi:hypothetical protein
MSFYNFAFGHREPRIRGKLLLSALGFTKFSQVGRYCDSWVENSDDGIRIAVYTRNGGSNRTCHAILAGETKTPDNCDCTGCIATVKLPNHPLYLRDADCTFDSTYATFYFRAPEQYAKTLATVAQEQPINMAKRWQDALAELEVAVVETIAEEIDQPADEQPPTNGHDPGAA